VHQLELQNDSWDSFITRNGYGNPDMEEVDKLVVEETLVYPTVPLSPTQACVSASYNKPLLDPKVIEQAREQVIHPNDSVKNLKKPTGEISKGHPDLNFKNKRVGRLISRKLRNKSNSHASSIKMIEIHESSDSEIDRFLAEEDPLSSQPPLDQPYNFVDNLPPCLKHMKGFLVSKWAISLQSMLKIPRFTIVIIPKGPSHSRSVKFAYPGLIDTTPTYPSYSHGLKLSLIRSVP
jgi:hypothetical protein